MRDKIFWEWVDRVANLLQIESYELLLKDAKNNDIMRHLQKQDRILDEQIHNYLEKIVKQNETIISLLEGRKSNGQNN